MARIIGTAGPDQLEGTDGRDVIRGRGGDDHIFGNLGDDRLYGDAGNDFITDYDGRNELRGGAGDDEIKLFDGWGYGGIGNDRLHVAGPGWAIGGKGDDWFQGKGAFWGDEGPGTPERVAGNDTFLMIADADSVRAHGGLGADRFYISLDTETYNVAVIDDFRPGEDKLQVFAQPPDGESAFDLFGHFDVAGGPDGGPDGVLDWQDWRGGVYVDAANNQMFLLRGPSWVTVQDTTQLAASDWLFDFGAT